MDHSMRNTSRPSAIPRLKKLSKSKPSVISSTQSRENLKSLKVDSGTLHNSRLRHTVSHDESLLSPPRHNSSIPRDINNGTKSYRISSSPLLSTERSCSRYLGPDILSKVQNGSFQEEESENLGRKNENLYDVSATQKRQAIDLSSLSGRAIETLNNIQSSPVLRRKDSKLFHSDSDSTSNSRQNSNSDFTGNSSILTSPKSARPLKKELFITNPSSDCASRRPAVNSRSVNYPPLKTGLKSPMSNLSVTRVDQNSPSPLKIGRKSIAATATEFKVTSPSLLRKPSVPSFNQNKESSSNIGPKKKVSSSSELTENTSNSKKPKEIFESAAYSSKQATRQKSSSELRDQIAKAKAAKRAASVNIIKLEASHPPVTPSTSFDFSLSCDPFNQKVNQDCVQEILKKRIRLAQKDGRLNISAMGLKEMPPEILKMYTLEDMGDISWAEMADLTRLNASDNEFEALPEDMFPDVGLSESGDDDDGKYGQFCGLEMIDLRENKLKILPLGMRRLEILTTLNLAGNQLTNDCFHIISQIGSLRDLNLERNCLSGELDTSLGNLRNLITLNIRQNKLSNLPSSISELTKLRILDVTQNQFECLSFDALKNLPLTEIHLAKNKLSGSLFPDDIDVLSNLQVLDVTCNSLSSLNSPAKVRLPSLQKLLCSSNRLTNLPNMTSWISLLTIDAEDNCIETLPPDLIKLPKIKSINFNGNQLRILDNRLGRMESLDILHISGNPLQEKKFASMSTDNLKRVLLSRLECESEDDKEADSDQTFFPAHESPLLISPASPNTSNSSSSGTSPIYPTWTVQGSGVLDRSNTQSHSLNPVAAAEIAGANKINVLLLHHNNFRVIPESVAFFAVTLTTLNLSHNELTSDTYMKDDLELLGLRELNLSSNTIDSLQPICHHLRAPNLVRLDTSFNRLSSLPVLRNYFPKLTTLLTSHNTIKELLPESIKGLNFVDCSSNEIISLNAKIGLLGGRHGLQYLDVRGNRFKVPKYTILEKGTEATLNWLRDKIPTSELTASDDEAPVD